MGVEECARLFLCVLCRRLVVFEPMTESVAPGLQPGNVKGVMGTRLHGQRDRRAVRACFRYHLATSIGRVQSSPSPIRIIIGAVIMTPGKAQTG